MKTSRKGSKIILEWVLKTSKTLGKVEGFFVKLTRQGWLAAVNNGALRRVLDFKAEYGRLWFIPLSEGG